MIQVILLLKTLAFLSCLSVTWIGGIWYMRTQNREILFVIVMTGIYSARMLMHIAAYVLYSFGSQFFLPGLYAIELIDVAMVAAITYYFISAIGQISLSGKLRIPQPFKIVAVTVMLLVYGVPRLFGILGIVSPGELRAVSIAAVGFVIIMLIYAMTVLLKSRKYITKNSSIRRTTWISLLGITIILSLGTILDAAIDEGYWIRTSRIVFQSRIFSSAAITLLCLPTVFSLLSVLSHLRGTLALIDVETAIQWLHKYTTPDEAQEQLLRYFFERGWSDTVQFYGILYVNRTLAPVLRATGKKSLLALLHSVQLEQVPSLREL